MKSTESSRQEIVVRNPLLRSRTRLGGTIHLVVVALVGVTLVGGGAVFWLNRGGGDSLDQPITAKVVREDFVSHVLDQGEIQSSENVEIRCKVESRGGSLSVIEVVPEGKIVKEGDFLVRLDASSFERDYKQQKLSVSAAETAVIQAKAAKETAEKSLEEYVEGTFVEQKIQIENEIYTAQMNLKQANEALAFTQVLRRKGIATQQTLDADEISVQQAKNSLKLASQKLKVLETISKEKELVRLNGDIKAAVVKLQNQEEDLVEEKADLEEIQRQIDNCLIVVPPNTEGQVVYAKQYSRGGNTEWVLEEGASVRERQVLIRLPDPTRMEVKAAINEQSITTIEEGMPVSIKVDALSNLSLQGIVTGVSEYAEGGGWGRSSVPKFPVYIQILDPPKTLKPGMNAAVTIQTKSEKDVLQIPIQCLYSAQDKHYCLVKTGEGSSDWETREVEVVADNSLTAWIKDGTDFTGEMKKGIEEGDEVGMNPGAYKDLLTIPEYKIDNSINISDEDRKKFEADQKKQKEKGKGGKTTKSGGKSGDFVGAIMAKDKDGDGKVSKDEMDERMRPMFDRMDGNKDGQLTRQELENAMKAFRKMRGGQGGGGGGDRGGRGGGGERGGGERGGRGGGGDRGGRGASE